MTRGTTPTLIFNICDCCIELSKADRIVVTFSQEGKVIFDKEVNIAEEVQGNIILLPLTKEETLSMESDKYVRYQAVIYIRGETIPTSISKEWVFSLLADDKDSAREVKNE